MVDNNLLHELPPFLSEVRKLEEVKFSGNNLYFPPSEVLARDWFSIKKYLKQFMTSSIEEEGKAESKTLKLTVTGAPNKASKENGQAQNFKNSIVSTEEDFTDDKFDKKIEENR